MCNFDTFEDVPPSDWIGPATGKCLALRVVRLRLPFSISASIGPNGHHSTTLLRDFPGLAIPRLLLIYLPPPHTAFGRSSVLLLVVDVVGR
jgi:hypothetical protein